jgi:hypothetical protein
VVPSVEAWTLSCVVFCYQRNLLSRWRATSRAGVARSRENTAPQDLTVALPGATLACRHHRTRHRHFCVCCQGMPPRFVGLCPAGTFRDPGEHKRLRDTRSGTRDIPGHVKLSGTREIPRKSSPRTGRALRARIVVLGGGQFLMSGVLLYGTDLTEMRCLCRTYTGTSLLRNAPCG